MYQTYNKLDSINLINKLDLNVLPQIVFKAEEGTDSIRGFLESHPAQFYSVRDNTKSNSPNRTHQASKEEVLNIYQKFDIGTLGVSQYNYLEDMIFTGNVVVHRNGEVLIEGTNQKIDSVREAVNNADIRISTDIFNKKLKYVKGAYQAIDYILEHNLQGMVVECSVFKNKIGVYQENVLIWELRTKY